VSYAACQGSLAVDDGS